MLKALLLSASFGDGHTQVANALYEEFSNRDVKVNVVDCFRETNQHLAKFNEWSYQRITRYFPSLYGASYKLTANLDTDAWLWKFLARSSHKALMDSVRRYQPDIILQLFPDHATETLERRHSYPYIGVVVTDFSVHSHWFHNNVDTYFIPNGGLRAQMERFLSSKSEIVDSGIPIRRQFHHDSIQYASHNPYVVLCAGGRGVFPDVRSVVAALLIGFPKHDVYVLCGRNIDMLHQVRLEASKNPRLRGLPYVEDVATLFRNASLAIVKSGGITVSELLACECPMIFYRPQPGQEEDNAAFLEKMGAGVVVRNHKDLLRTISHADITRWAQSMKRNCANLARPFAAESIVNHVLDKVANLGIRGAEHRMESDRSHSTVLSKPALRGVVGLLKRIMGNRRTWTFMMAGFVIVGVGLYLYYDRYSMLSSFLRSLGIPGITVAIILMAVICTMPVPSEGVRIFYAAGLLPLLSVANYFDVPAIVGLSIVLCKLLRRPFYTVAPVYLQ